jgi:exopolysaccharide production protein ExoZ
MPQILSIQYLRAIAAILVVALHSSIVIRRDHAPEFPMFTMGEFGVDIFFVISGFIMWTIAAEKPTTPAAFLERRVIRIVPLYWAITIPTAFVSTDAGLNFVAPDLGSLARSFFFIPEWNEKLAMVTPIVFVGWTLNLEMFFYAVFAAALYLPPRARLVAVALLLLALASSRLLIGVSDHPAVNLYTKSLVGEFAFGMLLGYAFQKGFARGGAPGDWRLGILLIALGVAAIPFREGLTQARLIHFGIPALMIVAGALLLERRLARRPVRLLRFLGDASYSIYLVHIMAQAVSLKFIGPLLGATSPGFAVLAQTLFGCLAGALAHVALEKPLTQGAARLLERLRKPSLRASRAAIAPAK